MPKPITPLVGADLFVVNEKQEVLLVKRSDNGFWCTPGGCQNLGESVTQCAEREFFEETGYSARATQLLGVFSSSCYEYVNYPWIDNEFTHVLYKGEITGGSPKLSEETLEIAWFSKDNLPLLSDGHAPRLEYCFQFIDDSSIAPYFE